MYARISSFTSHSLKQIQADSGGTKITELEQRYIELLETKISKLEQRLSVLDTANAHAGFPKVCEQFSEDSHPSSPPKHVS